MCGHFPGQFHSRDVGVDAGMPSSSGAFCGWCRPALGLGLGAGGNSECPVKLVFPPKDVNETTQKVTETQSKSVLFLFEIQV